MFEEIPKLVELGALGLINLVILFKLLPRIDKLSDAINQLSSSFNSQIDTTHKQFQAIDNRLANIDNRLSHIEHCLHPAYPSAFQKYHVQPDVVS